MPVAELDGSNHVVATFIYGSRYNTPDYMNKGGAVYRLVEVAMLTMPMIAMAATPATGNSPRPNTTISTAAATITRPTIKRGLFNREPDILSLLAVSRAPALEGRR